MPKGHVKDFLGLIRAICKDITAYHPNLRRGLERDNIRLESLSSVMGDNLFLIVLPALDKLLLRAFNSGSLVTAGESLTRPINGRTKIPRFLGGLWSLVLTKDGCLQQDIDPNDVLFLREILLVAKKFRIESAPDYRRKTIKEFYDVEGELPPSHPIWDGDGSGIFDADLGALRDRGRDQGVQEDLFERSGPDDHQLLDTVQRVADRIAGTLGEFLPQDYRFRHGPGAVSDLHAATEFKYSFPSWSRRLCHVFPADLFAVANTSILGDRYDRLEALFGSSEHHSRLIAVPKTATGPRLIAAEPTCHQWAQQCVRDFLTTRIKSSYLGLSIDFGRQDLSGEDARVSSHVGDRATMDLKSASDRLSCWLLQRLFRKNYSVLAAFIACRTRYIHNELEPSQPQLHKLRKFASMGSALTFPVQSIVFLMICLAAGESLTPGKLSDVKLKKLARLVRIYGDDLIVPVAWMPRVRYILERLYLRVNLDKTFSKGNFRESCGVDAFDGANVAPARILEWYSESKPSSILSTVEVANNFFKKGFFHAAEYIQSTVPSRVRKYIPVVHVESGAFGFVSFVGAAATSQLRWNRDLQRVENKAWCLTTTRPKTRREGFSNLLQYFTETPSADTLFVSGVVGRLTDKLVRKWVPLSNQVSTPFKESDYGRRVLRSLRDMGLAPVSA